jgi:PKD repeat protein
MNAGTLTGQTQAGWSVVGNGQYLAYAGEFPRVNGVAQTGLVRYALPGTPSPNDVGPAFSALFTTTVDSVEPGTARITWRATSDQDNENLVYRVQRDNAQTVVHTVAQSSNWADRILMTFTDTEAQPTSQYRVTATDPFGNQSWTAWTPISDTPAPAQRRYVDAVLEDGAVEMWSLGEATATAPVAGQRAFAALQPGPGVTAGVPGALAGDPDTAYSFDGTPGATMVLGVFAPPPTPPGFFVPVQFGAPETTTTELWFRTESTQPAQLAGFGDAATGDSTSTDRTIRLDAAGRPSLNVNVGAGEVRTITAPGSYNDGDWHYLAAQLSPAGMFMYVDGALVASRVDTPANLNFTGYVRVGGDAGQYFDGEIDEFAFYTTAPDAEMLATHYALGAGAAASSPPTARFTATQNTAGGTVLDGTSSTDGDGTITGYAWDFGDGTTGTGPTITHAYGAPGTYSVMLTVTDDDGRSNTSAQLVTVTANLVPTASFTSTVAGLAVSVDGSASADSDGTITGHAWNWGDGTAAGSGATASHTYAAAGTYTVTLTVTDDRGGTATSSRDVTVAAGPTVLVDDTFARTTTNGLGTADVGGTWTAHVGGTRQSVSGGTATMTLPSAGNNTGSYLGSVAQTTTDVRTTFSLSAAPTGNGTYVYVAGRRVDANTEYRARVRMLANGTVGLALSRRANGSEGFPGGETIVPGLTVPSTTALNVRVLTTGTAPTQVQVWVWRAGTTEPTAPAITRSDNTAGLQLPGGVGLTVHRPSSTTAATSVRFTAYRVTGAGGGGNPPANVPPTASFTATATGLQAAVNGSASSDPEGPIAGYSWNWGDSTPLGSGATATHTYAAAGTYTITLTVTDAAGATNTTTRQVTVASTPPPNTAPTASFTAAPTGLQVAVDGSGSTDTGGSITGHAWNWGDGTADGSGATATHTYAAAGTYTITLVVTDNGSPALTGTTTRQVTVTAPGGPAPLADDTFNRSVTNGWGSADVGGAWTTSVGGPRLSVAGGVGTMSLPGAGNNTGAYLGGLTRPDADVATSFSLSSMPTGSGTYVYVTGRRVSATDEYRVRVRVLADGRVALALSRRSGGTEAFPGGEVIVPGVTYTSGATLNVRVRVSGSGPSTITARVWTGATEPATWQMTRTDSTAALQANGSVGLTVHRPGNTTAATSVRFTAFTVTPVA